MGKKYPSLTSTLSKQIKGENIHNPYKRILFGRLIPWELQVATEKDINQYYIPHMKETISSGSSKSLQQDQLSRKNNYLANPLSDIKGLHSIY